MSVLDKKMLLLDLETKLNAYIPANTVRQITYDLGEIMMKYEVETVEDKNEICEDESQQLLKMFIDAKSIEGKSKATTEHYRYVLQRMIHDIKVPVRKITVYHLRQYMMTEKDRGISMNTIRGNNNAYSSFFTWLHKEGLIESNPTANISTIKARPEEEEPFTDEEIQLIKEAARNEFQLAMVYFLLQTGCRISEVCNLNIDDLDFHDLKLNVVGKGDKVREVYMDKVTALMLKRYLDTRKDNHPALFYNNRKGDRYTPGGIRRMLKSLEERSRVKGVHPHRFRHTFATNLTDRGMDIQEVSYILGHSKLDTTMTYVRVNKKNTENAYRKYACM